MKGKSKKINLHIAPGNWKRMEILVDSHNNNPDRQTPKLKYTDVVNEAIRMHLESK